MNNDVDVDDDDDDDDDDDAMMGNKRGQLPCSWLLSLCSTSPRLCTSVQGLSAM